MPHVIALRWRGRLNVRVRTPPSDSTSSSGSSTGGALRCAVGGLGPPGTGGGTAPEQSSHEAGRRDLEDGDRDAPQGQRRGEDDEKVAVAYRRCLDQRLLEQRPEDDAEDEGRHRQVEPLHEVADEPED